MEQVRWYLQEPKYSTVVLYCKNAPYWFSVEDEGVKLEAGIEKITFP